MTAARLPGVAVVGCGYWGKNLVRAFSRLGALQWLCDSDPVALEEQAALVPGIRTTARFDDLLEADISAIVIATPAALH